MHAVGSFRLNVNKQKKSLKDKRCFAFDAMRKTDMCDFESCEYEIVIEDPL